ncbi:GTPase [Streptomyces sp. B15]|uniref:GTPase n=1 Tax=Streptomyces sp. B15 TaxID=1537797 RepID=UPI0027DD885E|nr:GTPase [Streptomyces sp. B15]
MTSTDATNPGAGEPPERPERWRSGWPDGWVSPHSEPVEGQLELSLDEEAPPRQAPSQSGPDGSLGHRAAADLPRQQSEAAAAGPSEAGRVPWQPDGTSGLEEQPDGTGERRARNEPEASAQRAEQSGGGPAERPENSRSHTDGGRSHRGAEPQDVHAYAVGPEPAWDDGVIARRARAERAERAAPLAPRAEHPGDAEYGERAGHPERAEHGEPAGYAERAEHTVERAEEAERSEHVAAEAEAGLRAPKPRGHAGETDTTERGADHPRPGFAPTPPWRGTAWPNPPYGTAYEAGRETPPPAAPTPSPAVQGASTPAVQETPIQAQQETPVQAAQGPTAQAVQETPVHAAQRGSPDKGVGQDSDRQDSDRGVGQDVEKGAHQDTGTASSRNIERDLCRDISRDITRDLRRDIRRDPRCDAGESALRKRLGALRELVGLSRTRLDTDVLAEAGKVLDEAATRRALPRSYTTVALAGATGSGKSSLFNALTGGRLSEVGMRRPTTAAPVACTWEAGRYSDGGPDGLLDRLGIPQHARHRTHDGTLSGLILVDLPDHDSVAPGHREQVDRMLELVDAVVWVVDPEKYADALLHEDYLRQLAGHAEVTFVVLNQTDRLTRDAVDVVLDDLRRLLDEDGMALGEHGEPGAVVLSASALTHEGIDVLREELGEFVAQQRAAVLRLTADLDDAMERLRPVYAEPGPGTEDGPIGLTERAREDFEDRLAVAVGAAAAGQAAERAWLRQAEHSAGIPWVRALRWYASRPTQEREESARTPLGEAQGEEHEGTAAGGAARRETLQQSLAARPVVAQAVRELADAAASGLPGAWARTVRESARRGAAGLPEVLDEVMEVCASGPDAVRTASMTDIALGVDANWPTRAAAPAALTATAAPTAPAAPTVPNQQPSADASARQRGRDEPTAAAAAATGPQDVPEAAAGPLAGAAGAAEAAEEESRGTGRRTGLGARVPRPTWHTAAFAGQWLLLALQAVGAVWAVAMVVLAHGVDRTVLLPGALFAVATLAGPALAWACRRAARGPARAYGLEEERRLRQLAACCGRTRVLEPVAAELLRYRQVREQYAIAAGAVDSTPQERPMVGGGVAGVAEAVGALDAAAAAVAAAAGDMAAAATAGGAGGAGSRSLDAQAQTDGHGEAHAPAYGDARAQAGGDVRAETAGGPQADAPDAARENADGSPAGRTELCTTSE